MPDITIRFRFNPNTGQKQMVVHYESDEDMLPHEHERDHRALVEGLIGRPLEDDEEVVVERTEGTAERGGEAESAPAGRAANKTGGAGG